MTTFYLIRHGETDAIGKSLMGWMPGMHLNETGRTQAEKLPKHFINISLEAIYCSPLERAQQTAAPLANALGLPVELADEIGEVRYGQWTGLSMTEVTADPLWHRYNTFRSVTRPPGGELTLEVQDRVIGFLDKVHRTFPDRHVAIVSHGDPIKTAVMYYMGMHLDMILRFDISPASVTSIRVTDHDACVLCLNTHACAAT